MDPSGAAADVSPESATIANSGDPLDGVWLSGNYVRLDLRRILPWSGRDNFGTDCAVSDKKESKPVWWQAAGTSRGNYRWIGLRSPSHYFCYLDNNVGDWFGVSLTE